MMPSYRDGWTVANPGISYMLFAPYEGRKLMKLASNLHQLATSLQLCNYKEVKE